MVISVGFIRLKLNLSHGKLYVKFGIFNCLFFFAETIVKFRNLQISKILNSDTDITFPIPLKELSIHVSEIYIV